MNTHQILSLVNSCSTAKHHFKGVYASDTLPTRPANERPCTYICNLDPSYLPGSHWVAFYVPQRGDTEYFDSYGREAPPVFDKFLGPSGYIYNARGIQFPLSAVCGQYAIFYIWRRLFVDSMDLALDIFPGI